MSACPTCGTIPQPNDKFCNTCGTPVAQAAAVQAPPPAYAPPAAPQYAPPQAAAYGGAPQTAARCQMGHEIAPGQSYCAQGHPIALDAMQFANDAYGQPPQPQGYAPAPPAYAPPPQGYAPPAQGYAVAPGYAPEPVAPAYAAPPNYGGPQAYGAPQPPQPPPNIYGSAQQAGQAAYAPPAAAAYVEQAAPAGQGLPTTALRGFLVSYQSNTAGDFWPLKGGRAQIGRAGSGDTVDIPLADATISSRHAILAVDAQGGSIVVEDTGSTNGTFVNEEHLGFNGRRELRDGDRVRFGGYTTIVKIITRI